MDLTWLVGDGTSSHENVPEYLALIAQCEDSDRLPHTPQGHNIGTLATSHLASQLIQL